MLISMLASSSIFLYSLTDESDQDRLNLLSVGVDCLRWIINILDQIYLKHFILHLHFYYTYMLLVVEQYKNYFLAPYFTTIYLQWFRFGIRIKIVTLRKK
jgi:hypothetical protein